MVQISKTNEKKCYGSIFKKRSVCGIDLCDPKSIRIRKRLLKLHSWLIGYMYG